MKSPIRILQVFAHMNRGGAETMIMNTYRNIDRTKVQFDFIVHTDEKGAYDDEIKSLGGRIYNISRYNFFNHLAYIQEWKKFFEQHKEYRIIHGHVRSTASIYMSIAKKNRLITIAHSHSTSSRGRLHEKLLKNILQFPIRYISDYFFSCSTEAGEWLFGKRITKQSNYYIINNGVEINNFQFNEQKRLAFRNKLNIDSDKIVLGHIGSFTEPKNHIFLLDILKQCKESNENVILVLIGDGPLNSVIRKKISTENLEESVFMLGLRDDVSEIIHSFDKFVFPSLFEGLPVTLIEAQTNGLKCYISSNITKDVVLTDLLEYISLEESANVWAKKIIDDTIENDRGSYSNLVAKKGYDIINVADKLTNIYTNIVKITDSR